MDERLSGLHALSDAVLTCFGGIDRCHNPQMRHLLRSDTPPPVFERNGSLCSYLQSCISDRARLPLGLARQAGCDFGAIKWLLSLLGKRR
jgi:hypothetical protein